MTNHLEPESLSAYLDGELDDRERSHVEHHLDSCPDCSATRARLEATAGRVASLPLITMTVDEHRELRQALLNARPARRSRWSFGNLQWALTGGFAVLVVAVLGLTFLRTGVPDRDSGPVTEAAAPTTGEPDFDFNSGGEVDRMVSSHPEVAAALEAERKSGPPANPGPASVMARTGPEAADDAAQDSVPPGAATAPEGVTPQPGGGAAPGGGSPGAPSKVLAPAHGFDYSLDDVEPFTYDAADACLMRVIESQPYPMSPVLLRKATYQGTPAWLLVFAWRPGEAGTGPLDRLQTWVIKPQDCIDFGGVELEKAALYRSFPSSP